MNELSIVSSAGKYHIFDKRDGQTVGALVARDFETLESAVNWACDNYGLNRADFKLPSERGE